MVESEIAKLYEKLSLAGEDGAVHEMADEDQRDGEVEVELCLVGKVLSGKKVNRDAFKNLIEQLWSPFGRVEIHDVPIICMNRRTAKWMAEQIRWVIDLPFETKECWGKFLKVKVQIDISKPLKRWLRLKLDKYDNIVMVGLKYERLPEFCYVCGRIGHASKDCSDDEAKSEALKSDFTKYGSWMRASIPEIQKLRLDQQIEGNSKVQSRVLVERSGVKEVDMGKIGNGSLSSQAVEQTDTAKKPKEDVSGFHTNILAISSGLGSSQVHGLRLKGPSEEAQLNKKKNVVEGNESSGPGLKSACQLSPKQSIPRNWKRMAREKKVEFNPIQQPSLFRKLQTVSTKGKKNSKGNAYSSTSKSNFNIVGKRLSLGKFHNSVQTSSRDRGTLSSSLKRWDVKFGKRKLVIGSAVESSENKKSRFSDSVQEFNNLAESGSQARLEL
ncbi:hypothetical protein EZV62_024787 [Acer yangbiense]|uniref:CCHC-type domain-containing protein n=1 Tax=Acer yangbiense TaxID=1000413 RepID=A0A5C7GX56_9ROSI|nr:hypothetical protein EZV62_024787 [Acer yangbiense]